MNKEIEWVWKPLIPLSKVTMIQGNTNLGKTNILLYIMSMLSRGDYPPTLYHGHLELTEHGTPVKIYYISRENGIDDTVAPFFDIFGGDRDYVEYQEEKEGHFVLSGDEIRECVRVTGAKLIFDYQERVDNGGEVDGGVEIDDMDEMDSVPLSKAEEAALFLKNSLKDGPLDSRS